MAEQASSDFPGESEREPVSLWLRPSRREDEALGGELRTTAKGPGGRVRPASGGRAVTALSLGFGPNWEADV